MKYIQYDYIVKYQGVDNVHELRTILRETAEAAAEVDGYTVHPSSSYILSEAYSAGTVKITVNVAVDET